MFGRGRLYEVRKKSGKVGRRKELPISRRGRWLRLTIIYDISGDNHIRYIR